MALKDIDLSEEQQKELKDRLDAWKLTEVKKIEAQLTEKYEQMEAQLKEEYEDLVEEIKTNMKKVYTKRFTSALKEMYQEIKAEVIVESLNSPEAKALEEVKATVYPLINESTAKRHKDEFRKLASLYEANIEELELLKGANKKAQLMESLSPDVRKVVNKLLGEGNEEQIVTKFAAIKSALKEEVASKEETIEEDTSKDTSSDEETEEETHSEVIARSEIEDEDEPVKESSDHDFESMLNEQLILSGLRKAR